VYGDEGTSFEQYQGHYESVSKVLGVSWVQGVWYQANHKNWV